MARLLTTGAETNDATTEGVTLQAGVSIGTTNPRSGTRAYSGNGGTDARFLLTATLARTYYLRGYFRVDSYPASGGPLLLAFDTQAPAVMARVNLLSDGTLQLVHSAGQTIVATSAAVPIGSYFMVELSLVIGTGSVDAVEARLDGVSFGSASALNITDTLTWRASVYFPAVASGSVYADDIALNDSTGAAQNTWPGEGKVALLVPTADSAGGTGWTLGTGTALGGNGFSAVDNTPPTGVVDLAAGSDPKQIRNAASAANSNYDATMTTYSAAGIAATDTVNVIDPIVATAAPVVTSAKAGTVGVASNPAIANIALAAGGTSGAFWSGVAGGTFPTGWKISHGTVTYGSTVTVGTAPVMRVTQVTASTRIAVVCFMGMYVDYTPVVVTDTAVPYVGGGYYPFIKSLWEGWTRKERILIPTM